mgnify:CR=1 FL=1
MLAPSTLATKVDYLFPHSSFASKQRQGGAEKPAATR